METTHENSRLKLQFLPFATVKNLTKPSIERELLQKTSVLKSSKVRDLKPQFRSQLLEKTRVLPSATATVATDSGITLTHVKTEGVIPPSLLKNQERDYLVTEPKIRPSNTQPLIAIQNGNYGFLTEFNKISYLTPPKNRERDYFLNQLKIQPIDTQPLINNPVRFL